MNRSLIKWQVGGFLITATAGVLLHFVYEWGGKALPLALISAVNESIWEHLKLLYVPLTGFALFQSRALAKTFPNFWCAKLWSTLAGLITIPLLYYTYTGALGVKADWFNIFLFFVAVAVAFVLDTHLLRQPLPCRHPRVALAALLGLGVLFAVLTFIPPHIPLFRDPLTGLYGI